MPVDHQTDEEGDAGVAENGVNHADQIAEAQQAQRPCSVEHNGGEGLVMNGHFGPADGDLIDRGRHSGQTGAEHTKTHQQTVADLQNGMELSGQHRHGQIACTGGRLYRKGGNDAPGQQDQQAAAAGETPTHGFFFGNEFCQRHQHADTAEQIVGGIGENKYAPRISITRQDMMVIVYRALQQLNVGFGVYDEPKNEDFSTIAEYAKPAVTALIGAGIVNGKSGRIAPLDYTTRAEIAVLIKRVLDLL